MTAQTPDDFDAVAAVRGMCELLWKGQADRHGSGHLDAPLSVSQPEAEAAAHLAVALVQLFAMGAIRPH